MSQSLNHTVMASAVTSLASSLILHTTLYRLLSQSGKWSLLSRHLREAPLPNADINMFIPQHQHIKRVLLTRIVFSYGLPQTRAHPSHGLQLDAAEPIPQARSCAPRSPHQSSCFLSTHHSRTARRSRYLGARNPARLRARLCSKTAVHLPASSSWRQETDRAWLRRMEMRSDHG